MTSREISGRRPPRSTSTRAGAHRVSPHYPRRSSRWRDRPPVLMGCPGGRPRKLHRPVPRILELEVTENWTPLFDRECHPDLWPVRIDGRRACPRRKLCTVRELDYRRIHPRTAEHESISPQSTPAFLTCRAFSVTTRSKKVTSLVCHRGRPWQPLWLPLWPGLWQTGMGEVIERAKCRELLRSGRARQKIRQNAEVPRRDLG